MYQISLRTITSLSFIVRWSVIVMIGTIWQAHSQVVPQAPYVDNSYSFYYEEPCCKSHVRHRRGKCFYYFYVFN